MNPIHFRKLSRAIEPTQQEMLSGRVYKVGEAETIFDSLDHESEVWLSAYMSERFGEVFNLPELITAVKEFDLQAEPF